VAAGTAAVGLVSSVCNQRTGRASVPKPGTGIPISAYSFRHKIPTVLRKAQIPEDQIAIQLGHRRSEKGVTAAYGEWSPDHLASVAKAFDA